MIAELERRRVDEDGESHAVGIRPVGFGGRRVASAMNSGYRRASGQMRMRTPCVTACRGWPRVPTKCAELVDPVGITWLIHLDEDEQALAVINAALADRATAWGPLSEDKLRQAVEVWISRYDPDAVRRTRVIARGRDLTSGNCDDETETTSVWGHLLATDAAVLTGASAIVRGVCDGDPRSMGERRADALGALAAGNQRLACASGSASCPSPGRRPNPTSSAGASPPEPPSTPPPPNDALLLGRGVLPTPLLAEAIRNGTTIKPIRCPRRTRAALPALPR